ncbi:MAG: AzlD domain-containing protein [Silicimonas sp.]
MSYSNGQVWLVIALLGIGTYLVRLSFLGLIGDRKMPDWVLRHLRYTPVAVLPGLVAPLAVWPSATGGDTDPARMTAALVTLLVAYWRKNMLWGIAAGALTLALLLNLGVVRF